ncbi:Retrotransposon, unclassified-like protein [Senna tora]|uniref:Retrotransposon, unclassified-like protein n=1 Tax=Senna tora TaxID=362788 RepID=A0A834WZ94_9FABA|nr:Retrotransposon, unclassified-like protein [Senna tora]
MVTPVLSPTTDDNVMAVDGRKYAREEDQKALFFDEHAGKGTSMPGPPVGIKLEKKKEKVEECKKKEGKKGFFGDTGASSSGTKRHATKVFEKDQVQGSCSSIESGSQLKSHFFDKEMLSKEIQAQERDELCELKEAPHTMQDGPKHLEDELELVYLSSGEENPRPVFINQTLVHKDGINVDESKVKAVLNMKNPGSKDDVRTLIGKLSYIRRFIPALSELISPFQHLLKKGSTFKWEEAEQEAFEKIKKVLASTQTMSPPTQGRSMALYLTSTNQSIGALLVQEVEGIEKPIYYLSRFIKGAETRYSAMEKYCLALIYATQKFMHYFLAYSIDLMTKSDPIRFLLKRPILSGRLTRWTLIIGDFDITPVLPRAIRSQALVDLLALFPSGNHEPIDDNLSGELPEVAMCEEERLWELHFDRSPSQPEGGAGIVLTDLLLT